MKRFRSLAVAFARAASCTTATQIWVAKGTYTPTTGTDRNASFVLRNGFTVYGGFAGTETQLSQRLLVSDLASAVRLSPSHFARAFKQTIGCSPHNYLLRRRIERAKDRMRTTDEPLAQIALTYGFSDQAHFTRCFKRHEGETPTAWYRRVTSESPRNRTPALA